MAKKLIWHTELRRVKDLVRYDKNPRKLSPEQLEGLKRSLRKFNVAELPCINTDGTLVAGNQRVLALSLIGRGDEEIEVRVPNRSLTEAEFKDYLLTSNRSGGSWDFEKLAADFDVSELLTAGFDSLDLSNIFDDSLEVSDDEFDEEKEFEKAKKTDIKQGDLFALGRHRLLCADSTVLDNVKRLMGDARADMVNTDTPYNISLSYDKGIGGKKSYGGTTNDSKSDEEYLTFLRKLIQNALAASKKDAHILFWNDECHVHILQSLYKELGIDSKRLLIWLKDNSMPTPKIAFNKVTEFCVYGTVGKPWLNDRVLNLNEVMNKEVASGNRLTDDILDLLNIWMVKRLPSSEYEHPTQKSPTLHEKALRRCTRPGDIVLDLTAGSGSILSACDQLKRTAYLAEAEPVFAQLIINRFKKLNPHEKVIKLN